MSTTTCGHPECQRPNCVTARDAETHKQGIERMARSLYNDYKTMRWVEIKAMPWYRGYLARHDMITGPYRLPWSGLSPYAKEQWREAARGLLRAYKAGQGEST